MKSMASLPKISSPLPHPAARKPSKSFSLGTSPPPPPPPPISFPQRHLLFAPRTNTFSIREELSITKKQPPLLLLDDHKEQSLIERCAARDHKLLKDLSSWGIGGPCSYFLQVFQPSQLVSAVRYCRERCIPCLIIGKGSNCLFDDQGFDGFVIQNRLDQLEVIVPGVYRVESGYPFNRLGVRCSVEGFSGLEFAAGIPGTVGGAVFMNAGADGQESGDVVDSVEIVNRDGEMLVLKKRDLTFGYRWSSFQDMKDLAAIVAVTFRLKPAATARERQRVFLERRRKTQPIGERSAGSVFRNPPDIGISAGKLIELAGLKGFAIGGAKISDVHANFFINFNRSTSRDMLLLIDHAKESVYKTFQVELKEEIKYVPYKTET